jgi:hypothetical protein
MQIRARSPQSSLRLCHNIISYYESRGGRAQRVVLYDTIKISRVILQLEYFLDEKWTGGASLYIVVRYN